MSQHMSYHVICVFSLNVVIDSRTEMRDMNSG